MNYIISTDLDGTLIDHHDYSFDAAAPAIERCKTLGIPIVLNTSKTAQEAKALQLALGLDSPLVVENGSAIVMSNSASSDTLFGASRYDVLNFIQSVRKEHKWRFEGFNDWSIQDIIKHTGLSQQDAKLANTKQYSEPFVWQDSAEALQRFSSLANDQGLSILKGGRFYHLQGQTDKAKPLKWMMQHYSTLFPSLSGRPKLIALGDNHNDIAMLNAADIAVCVRSPVADYPALSTSSVIKVIQTTEFGPAGWNEAISQILDQH